ncbi:hypothetical protein [Rhodococcus kyotonensis]|uniref:Uncharacterized protein n=1 Tax=Rhodococcoides kyotonense TaxID=398843 RepID=A0A177YIQ2_9NOCA|nr:hypothetical protein [Rhodococcus kyotonensis]NIL78177.1 hypothetical protein [Rhodococcus sp. B10]OAK55466.1 hypothetical protein A3K89_20315 [Rhodococcus kyotonensis]
MFERRLTVPDVVERENLTAFLGKAVRLDEAAVVRLRMRADGRLSVWATTGFDALAVRVVDGTIVPDDTSAGADGLLTALASATSGEIDPGFSMDSAWRGALPPDHGFEHVDDVPARVLIDLAQRGAALAKQHGSSHGPPVSLLDQDVLHVEGPTGDVSIAMRTVFALTAMGFVPATGQDPMTADIDLSRIASDERVRVRATAVWLRLDARFGSVFSRRGNQLSLSVER